MISLRSIAKAVMLRFLPGYAMGVAALLTLGSLTGGVHVGWELLVLLCALACGGFGAMLAVLRFRLRATADVTGRRSLLAGVLAPPAMLTAMVAFRAYSQFGVVVIAALVGAAMALAMYLPWLKERSTPALTDEEASLLLAEHSLDWEVGVAGSTARSRARSDAE